jgi:hypothetical protein
MVEAAACRTAWHEHGMRAPVDEGWSNTVWARVSEHGPVALGQPEINNNISKLIQIFSKET